jgi:hypothetical protein
MTLSLILSFVFGLVVGINIVPDNDDDINRSDK